MVTFDVTRGLKVMSNVAMALSMQKSLALLDQQLGELRFHEKTRV